jgi:hypothetical protein
LVQVVEEVAETKVVKVFLVVTQLSQEQQTLLEVVAVQTVNQASHL